jgi:short-subunit dehydrogenase
MDVRGRRVLVTGASRGIGESIARSFAAAGARLALVARSEAPLKELASDLDADAFPADLGDPVVVAGLLERVEADGGPIDILVNNAAMAPATDFTAATAPQLEQVYRLNLLTPVELCRQVLPGMVARGAGHIVNVSSLAGTAAFPGLVAYSSTKAGLSHFTAGLRADLRGLPVRTTLVELGPVPTDMLSQVDDYLPTELSFRRFYRTHLLVHVDRETVATAVLEAVRRERRHVRLPRRAAVFALLAETPRRTVELLLTRVPHRES